MTRASGNDDGFADADLTIGDPAKGDNRGAGAFGAEAREGLGVTALGERGDR
ncbi:MAG: hypothetical protein V9F04_11640 [Dermatophilaceae bacterium]